MSEADVIVVGAGHNSLVAAAYLAVAGYRVKVLEGRERPGGDTCTEELTLPGVLHDSCSSAHNLIQSNPLIRDNELRLDAYGLEYLFPEPAYVFTLPDGESITMHRDVERTAAEIARHSPRDAAAYRELLADWEKLRPLQARERGQAPLPPEELDALWRSGPLGVEALRLRAASALQVIEERFEHPHVRAFMAWTAMLTLEPVDRPFTGLLAFSLVAGRQQHSWTTPRGGSFALPAALIRRIEAHGGEVECGAWVERILVEGGRAAGVVTRDGRTFRARVGVLSSQHVTQLPGALGEHLDDGSRRALSRWRAGLTMFVSHYALAEAPRYRTHGGDTLAVAMGVLDSIDALHAQLAAFRRGRVHTDRPYLLCVASTVVDRTRAPQGMHTLKVIGIQPYDLAEGPQRWDEIKDEVSEALLETYLSRTVNLTRRHILAKHVESPLDLERRNPNNFRGSCHGGDVSPDQSGWLRPAAGWAGYRTPVPGLYLTGACTHPGGSVSGMPGRNAARAMLADLGVAWDEVLARAAARA
ncbi:MAG: NAD(P)/FAD-dependent oxidoreductase [Firmicutes bacterium]|nr:NAD(P)/FAD-dependent oxidoreductase [Bacillota bacterium]